MRPLLLLTAFCLHGSLLLHAQLPELTASDKTTPITLLRLEVDVKILGNRAATTFTLTFHNPSAKILEGTFLLPLPQSASVTRYALDIDGKMREGVAVEKTKAAQVFESVEKRKVDPGLLEQTTGNVFRTRIYPLPAGGERRIIVGFEQELSYNNKGELVYHLPFESKSAVKEMSLNVVVQEQGIVPVLDRSPLKRLQFSAYDHQYCAYAEAENAMPSNPLIVRLTKLSTDGQPFVQYKNGSYYFYYQTYLAGASKEKTLPKKLAVVWDVSLSGVYRNIQKEKALLQAYLRRCGDVQVELYLLRNTFTLAGVFPIHADNSKALLATLEKQVYDGGTDYSALRFSDVDETLFFTDGISTLSDYNPIKTGHVLYTISSSTKADYGVLKNMAEANGGTFINLNTTTQSESLAQLTTQRLQFLGIKQSNAIEAYYPATATPVQRGFSIAGRLKNKDATLGLQFGYGRTVVFEKAVRLHYDEYDDPDWDLAKLVAQKTIETLDANYERHKEEISRLARQYNLVTRNTSLLVLERVEDYVQHSIEPPTELMPAYKRLLHEQRETVTENQQSTLENAITYSNQLWQWWNTSFPRKEKQVTRTSRQAEEWTDSVAAGTNNQMASAELPPPPSTHVADEMQTEHHYERPQQSTSPDPNQQHEAKLSTPITLRGAPTINNELQGRAAGVQLNEVVVVGYSAQTKSVTTTQSKGDLQNRLLVVDGVIAAAMPPKGAIQDMVLLEPSSATNLYGSAALHGALIITTKGGAQKGPRINLEQKTTDAAYVKMLAKTPVAQQYQTYLQLRDKNLLNPTFYYDVATFFLKRDTALGLQVLTNLSELDYQNHELYKLFGYKLQELGRTTLAEWVYHKVLLWRPQEPQSYRDYALALKASGKYQASLDTLYLALTKGYQTDIMSDYDGIEETIVTELNNLIQRSPEKLNTTAIDKALLHDMPVDIRVVLNWNMDDTDMDLWVTDPAGEKCFYGHKETQLGGRLSDDFTDGYGPEQFLLKKAVKGKYLIQVHYYGENGVKVAGRTTLLVEVYTGYGTSSEQRRLITLQLEGEEKEGIYVGTFEF